MLCLTFDLTNKEPNPNGPLFLSIYFSYLTLTTQYSFNIGVSQFPVSLLLVYQFTPIIEDLDLSFIIEFDVNRLFAT